MIPVSDMHNFFDGLPPEVQAAFDAVSRFRQVAAGETIVRAGKVCGEVYQLHAGKAKSSTCDREGRETVTSHFRDGDWICVSELFTGLPAIADVVALTPVHLRTVRQRDFESLMDRFPIIARHLLRVLSLRFSFIYHQGSDRNTLSLKERLIKTLYMLSFSQGKKIAGSDEILIHITQDELGKLLGASRQNLNRALKALAGENLLDSGYGSIRLHGLNAIAQRYGYLINVDQPAPIYGP